MVIKMQTEEQTEEQYSDGRALREYPNLTALVPNLGIIIDPDDQQTCGIISCLEKMAEESKYIADSGKKIRHADTESRGVLYLAADEIIRALNESANGRYFTTSGPDGKKIEVDLKVLVSTAFSRMGLTEKAGLIRSQLPSPSHYNPQPQAQS